MSTNDEGRVWTAPRKMTREEFYQEHCLMCGTQRCPADDEAISTCGHYTGNIDGIPKKETLKEVLEKINKIWKELN